MRITSFSSLAFALLLPLYGFAQHDSTSTNHRCGLSRYFTSAHNKGLFYFAWGYNENWYSKSDVRVHDASGDYDFTLYDMKAHDRNHLQELFNVALSIPQYGYRLGYWMPNGKFGFEIKFDHAKYIVDDYQTVHLKGRILGEEYDVDTLVGYSFMHLEHTDGANFLMLNGMYRYDFLNKRYIRGAFVGKFGAGIVVPRSDVTLFGQRWNHCFHVAGQVAGAELGLRFEFFRYLFIEPSIKGVFANFNNVLAVDDILISHRFWDGMVLLDAGMQFPLGKPRSKIPQPAW